MKKLLVMLLLVASSAYGEFYTWTDSRRVTHYTNSLYEIPARYRAKAKVMNLGLDQKADPSTAQPNVQAQPMKPEGQPTIPGATGNIIQQNAPSLPVVTAAPTPPVTVAPAGTRQMGIQRKQGVRRSHSNEMDD